ncbi:hypothetical protein MYP_3539 [Sporocytophaga myxococcoides]|uniref:Uncharacterized protein n=1 Tax=Sporocytophaga myxococcoides TaxID=153721 RepID=A0A098LH96_9BACT|nr:hypothetical protein MYP_3539 [Sporocytophaga myxococcoides]
MRYLLLRKFFIYSPTFPNNSYLLLDKTNTIFNPYFKDHIEFYKDSNNKLVGVFKNF